MIENYFPAVIFAIVMLGSPGPAVIALLYSGVRYGFYKTIPFFSGIILGFSLNLIFSAIFYSGIFKVSGNIHLLFKIISYAYILYISYNIAKSSPISEENRTTRHFGMLYGFFLNITNPKAYIASLASFSIFVVKEDYIFSMIVIFFINLVTAILLQGAWVIVGSKIRGLFKNKLSSRVINIIFALALIFIVIYSLYNDIF